ncbi:MAG: hypothetical protein ACFE95_09325 [Candidatus Hodarchaeota archaeon]
MLFGILIGNYRTLGTNQTLLSSLFIIEVFTPVLVHEFDHSLISGYFGYHTKGIILYPLEGMASIPELSIKSKEVLLVSPIGPLSNYVIAILPFSMNIILRNNSFTFMEIPIAD